MTSNKKLRASLLITVLGLLTAMGPFSVDPYLPAFPEIVKGLQTDLAHVSYTLSSFFIGLSVGQLIYGPLLERYGRKRPIYIGLTIYAISTAGCALSQSIEALIFFRFLQAIGSCAGLVSARTIVRDLFKGKKVAKVFSTLMMVVAVSPIIAPTVGGLLTTYFGWRSIFIVLFVFSMIMILGAILIVPHTKKPNTAYILRPGNIFQNYLNILKNPSFFLYALTGSIAYSGLYAYISGSPHLYMNLFGLNEQQYSWVFAIIATGLIGSSQINNLVLKKHSMEKTVQTAIFMQCIIGSTLLATSLTGATNLWVNTFLIFAFISSLGFIFPNCSALAMEPMGHTAGNASALMGAIQMSIGAIASAFVGMMQNATGIPMALIMTLCGFLALGLYFLGKHLIKNAIVPVH
ncbi:multidrug effflux MFS transporter [Reichenbachiella ulvae]|uniref:Multidrug effflux MFS transporter n=1 Tax=Reichenbachiella ulvae TaxID=2980104 RepID=A0ABT3CNP9_9BACT|nr:multidrug effflux MFS transporter [Reichenbachiella ulvae]MCV9385232.1 multidrug effflux MFS transporter [Reichenbachiella ulvae]